MAGGKGCIFCDIIQGKAKAALVFEDDHSLAFLDHRPLLPGHVLLVPRIHVETLPDLPADLAAPLLQNAQRLCRAIEKGLAAEGTFVAVNNKISQSVPHLHVHVVPRWKGDGLFSTKMIWKRSPYKDDDARRMVQEKIKEALTPS
jgi:histidine triad (HIT) family protein